MTDEPTLDPALEEDVDTQPADPSAPPEGTRAQEPEVDWQKRYTDLQSTYTKTSQEAAELREWRQQHEAEQAYVDALNDPDTQQAAVQALTQQLGDAEARQWLEAHGFELEDDELDDTGEQFRDPRVDDLLAERAQQQVDRQVQEVEDRWNKRLDELAAEKGVDLNVEVGEGEERESLRDLILDAAATRTRDGGVKDVERAFDLLLGFQTNVVKGYRQTKRGPSTPPPKGGPGEPASPLGSQKARLELANQIAEEAAQSA